jgi:MoaA/NifB/PqqE/SkfB family radical SAM enzyme
MSGIPAEARPCAVHQLEITTRCNFSCFYCAGRDMPQQDMPWERFTAIVDAIPGGGATVSLQGEGEPSLHPRFWDMAAHVLGRGHEPTTILNGSRVDAPRIARHFPKVAVSVDTLDEAVAERIGRHNLPKVLAHLDSLVEAMGAGRIGIMTVHMGQPIDDLVAWVRERGFAYHVVQPLQPKADYGQRYKVKPPQALRAVARGCQFLSGDIMRFYPLQGPTLPCCFIKDARGIESIDGLRQTLAEGRVPFGCVGCRHLREQAPDTDAD